MPVYPSCESLMKYGVVQNIVEKYYRFRVKRPCFVVMQNERWTLVTPDH